MSVMFSLANLRLHLSNFPLPYWIEYAPFLWGEGVNYDSDGDAYNEREPTYWTFLNIQNCQTNERLIIKPWRSPTAPPPFYRDAEGRFHFECPKPSEEVFVLSIEGDDSNSVRLAAYLTALRSHGAVLDPQTNREICLDEIAAPVADMDVRIAAADKTRTKYDERLGI